MGNDKRAKSGRKHVPGKVFPFLARELAYTLTTTEWKVWSILFLHGNREGFCHVGNETLSEECNIGHNANARAKRGLIKKGWLENCGQRGGWQSNNYHMKVPLPESVWAFHFALWETLRSRAWWEQVGDDAHDYAEDHLDWLIGWREVRALRDAGWCRGDITDDVWQAAMTRLLSIVDLAGERVDPTRGLWWVLGDGFDEANNATPSPK